MQEVLPHSRQQFQRGFVQQSAAGRCHGVRVTCLSHWSKWVQERFRQPSGRQYRLWLPKMMAAAKLKAGEKGDSGMKVQAVKYVIMAQDMERGIEFDKNIIGIAVNSKSEMWTELGFGNAIIALHGGGSGESSSTGLSFQVNDIEAARKEVVEGGARVLMGPSGRPEGPIRLADLADTEGNRFMLSQYVGGHRRPGRQ